MNNQDEELVASALDMGDHYRIPVDVFESWKLNMTNRTEESFYRIKKLGDELSRLSCFVQNDLTDRQAFDSESLKDMLDRFTDMSDDLLVQMASALNDAKELLKQELKIRSQEKLKETTDESDS